ncbi:MAG: mannitol dehydrogenase family protein [Polaromonas sp.]|uniref:mannitol dehydrogenase family protein n=1 Tax=Polaromonas sp. TaxID=1869339 RepID=UPI00273449AA|nr:mannitol dehydrogenase family protein [Polaromonas sp.]MDP2820523.1 mannitol dehydrogenase family protein [Polaromonas sp.]
MIPNSADMAGRLNSAALPALAARSIHVPGYPRSGAPGVVHLGLGAFFRAHQALVFDTLLQRGDTRWGVFGVAMRSTALADSLQAQDGLYAVQVASSAGSQWQVGGAIWQTAVAARAPAWVVQSIAAPSTRWLTLTVTEKGYRPELAQLIVQGLSARLAAGLPGLTIASCDNLVGNGRQLQALCLAAAQTVGPALADWVAGNCAFPNSMVDRIVPAATPQRLAAAREALGVADEAALGTEAFWEWVIERRFADASDADTLAAAGVTVVDDVAPFEAAKLRLLNGSHTAMACMGAVAGWPVIGECIMQPAVRSFIHGLMTQEVGPQLARPDWPAYRDALLARFANPALQHSVHQIANDSSQKIPQRWPPSVLGALRAGLPVDHLAFAAAAWMRYLRGSDELGQSYAMHDPMAGELQALALAHAGDAAASVQALGRLPAIWDEVLSNDQRWLALVTRRLDAIGRLGVLGALVKLQAGLDGE